MSALLVRALLVRTVVCLLLSATVAGILLHLAAVWQRGLRHFDVNVLQSSRAFALRLLSSAAF